MATSWKALLSPRKVRRVIGMTMRWSHRRWPHQVQMRDPLLPGAAVAGATAAGAAVAGAVVGAVAGAVAGAAAGAAVAGAVAGATEAGDDLLMSGK